MVGRTAYVRTQIELKLKGPTKFWK